ncbi:YiiX/YebB-like N1pC/P60 family cysteine hydrolase [Zooshikella sp. RANM57]|uniref:YiiX/YebB-like N1pC/P60 family cysteine hydrolase n=1 Tax=Zooshikella sp. RANM57 TaxID=3425863 RepID=UPI003D6E3789
MHQVIAKVSDSLTDFHDHVACHLQEGDLIFISIKSALYKQVAQTTNTWTSHVGIVIRENNEWWVAESAVPFSRKTRLKKFLKRTVGTQVCIRRLNGGLSREQLLLLKASIDSRMGILYHLGFDFNAKRQYCSKFVHHVYAEALNLKLGKVVTFEELLKSNPDTNLWFWRLWYFGRIPWNRKTLTPQSQLVDQQLETILLSEN